MVHILLVILRIIGILLLSIVGLLLLLLCLVLFVPLRYRAQADYHGKPNAWVKLTWLLHLFAVTASYDGKLKIIIKVFGFPLTGLKKQRRRGRQAGRRIKKTAKKLKDTVEKPLEPLTETAGEALEDIDMAVQELTPIEETPEEERVSQPENEVLPEHEAADTEETEAGEEPGWLDRLRNRLRAFWHKLCGKIKNIGYALRDFCVRIKEMKAAAGNYKALWDSPERKRAWKLVKKEGWRLIRHIKPKKLKLQWKFGFEDPAVTGEVLAFLAMFYGLYYKRVTLLPVFDGVVQEGEFYCRGRIRTATLLIIFCKLYFNKDIRYLKQKLDGEEIAE